MTAISFRMSAEEREQLELEAREGGFDSLQQLLEVRVFGEARPRRRPGPQPQEDRLPVSA